MFPRPLLPSTSMIRASRPARAARRAPAAVPVVLPAPPFPATMSSRAWAQNAPGSNPSPPGGRRIRRLAMVVAVTAALFGLAALAASPATAAPDSGAPPTVPTDSAAGTSKATSASPLTGHIEVVQVSGLMDPIQVEFLRHAVVSADQSATLALVIQLDSGGGIVSPTTIDNLATAIARSPVPVAVWVGPNGTRALGQAYTVFRAAELRGMAAGTRVGDALVPTDPLF